jgi:site-specific DNA recombinase
LLTEDHARLFADEFRREMARLTRTSTRKNQSVIERLTVVTREIDTLAVNMLAAVASPALLKLFADREAEKTRLEEQLGTPTTVAPPAAILPHPALLQLFDEKVGRLREMLNAETVRGEAAEILSTLIESVTIYPESPHGPEAEVVAKVTDLMAFATNDDAAPKGGVSSSIAFGCGDRI